LFRHGEIETGGERRFVGQRDLPLTKKGIRQAAWWHDTLKGKEFSALFCSDLSRCVRTAEIIAGPGMHSLVRVPQFREIYLGEWEGLAVEDVRNRFPDQWRDRVANLSGYRPPGGESFLDLQSRVVPMFEELVTSADGDLLIVAHNGVNRMILCHVLGMPAGNLLRIAQDYGCLNVISHDHDGRQVLALNLRPGLGNPV
jgi:probable phosphoglycerate mutase